MISTATIYFGKVYEVRPRKDRHGVDLISDALPFGRLWYGRPNAVSNAISYAMHSSRSHNAVIRVYDEAGNVIRDARAGGRFQRVVKCHVMINGLPENTLISAI